MRRWTICVQNISGALPKPLPLKNGTDSSGLSESGDLGLTEVRNHNRCTFRDGSYRVGFSATFPFNDALKKSRTFAFFNGESSK